MKLPALCDLMVDESDAPPFLECVGCLIAGCALTHAASELRIFKLDNWFGEKWLGYCRYFGRAEPVRNPPFARNRVVAQCLINRNRTSGQYELLGNGPLLYDRHKSETFQRRHVKQIAPNAHFYWYSGNSVNTSRGSLMGYIPIEEGYWTWYASFAFRTSWIATVKRNVDDFELGAFVARCRTARPTLLNAR